MNAQQAIAQNEIVHIEATPENTAKDKIMTDTMAVSRQELRTGGYEYRLGECRGWTTGRKMTEKEISDMNDHVARWPSWSRYHEQQRCLALAW